MLARSTVMLRAVLLRPSAVLYKRFVPPWERDGKSAEDFFAGILASANPVHKARKHARRVEEATEAMATEDPLAPEDYRRAEECDARNAVVEQKQMDFLPYGAKPKEYFDGTRMAAWGEYVSKLEQMPSGGAGSDAISSRDVEPKVRGYDNETKKLLVDDMYSKIPYRYTTYVPLPEGGALRWPLHGTAGVVMDVDGVIYRSHTLIAGGDTAIATLKELRIPFVFMTNGGSKSEVEKAEELSGVLGTYVDPAQVLVSHSPMRLLAERYRRSNVLVVGPPHCVEIARAYGFEKATSILEYQAAHAEMLPLKKWDREPVVKPQTATAGETPFPYIDAILQMHDPDDPFNDIQTIVDVLTSRGGHVGSAVSGIQSVPYYAAADDLLWATEAPLPRLGQGAFREMLSSVYECVTGQGLQVIMYGKPRAIAHAYAAQRLRSVAEGLGWDPRNLRAAFMVGDNLETDILGANAALAPWVSVHVMSGIGDAPAARRTLSPGDAEHEWLETAVPRTPHYIAPTLDHFVRELLAFPEQALVQNRQPYYGPPNPVDLKELYNFSKEF